MEENSSHENIENPLGVFAEKYKLQTVAIIVGFLIIVTGLVVKSGILQKDSGVEIYTNKEEGGEIIVEIAGSVAKPGVYKMEKGKRVEDLLVLSGGFSEDADLTWVETTLNRASILEDGQKIFIKPSSEQPNDESANNNGGYQTGSPQNGGVLGVKTNINTSSLTELDSLPGIGQVYGQKIIEQRPYSDIGDLVKKDVLPQSTYEKIKDLISVY